MTTGVPDMAVPVFTVVNVGLAMMFLGGGMLLLVAFWWARASDGVEVPRSRWPLVARFGATGGWLLWVVGIAVQLIGYFGDVGVARW